jgi:stringent starvation protein B
MNTTRSSILVPKVSPNSSIPVGYAEARNIVFPEAASAIESLKMTNQTLAKQKLN